MTTTYKIYVVNQSASTQLFWCFLTPPEALVNNPGVYANSSASLSIAPNYGGTNEFVIPVQYVVGAGASNQAVGLNVQVLSNYVQDSDLGEAWLAAYANAPPNAGPTISSNGTTTSQQIAITTNAYDQVANDDAQWYSNQSFGIQTEAGFVGMTWAPSPQQVITLTPLLSFYIAVGSYGENTLASWDQVSTGAAQVNVPSSFDSGGNSTVTYTQDGGWTVTPGVPATSQVVGNLAWFKSAAHQELVALAYVADGSIQPDTLVSVTFGNAAKADVGEPVVVGTITVATALTAAFAVFVISGITIHCKGKVGATKVDFSYSGSQSAKYIKSLFVAGAKLAFGMGSGGK